MLKTLKHRLFLNRSVLFLVDLLCVVAALKLAYAARFYWEWGARLVPSIKWPCRSLSIFPYRRRR
ncbi:MAG: hypothetical protein IPP35_12515 [Elusimicrobia bacterium]|nr:hypothetical protein [Elusimicrobiota bacterium]